MKVRFYFDVHVPRAIAIGIRMYGIDVLTAQEDRCDELPDEQLLERCVELGRILVSQDADFLRIGHHWQSTGRTFHGIVYSHQLRASIGETIEALALLGMVSEAEEWVGRIEYIPLK